MTKMTSAYANKMLRKLNEDKEFWKSKESEGCLYVAALDEEPVIPEYDYEEVSKNISEMGAWKFGYTCSIWIITPSRNVGSFLIKAYRG